MINLSAILQTGPIRIVHSVSKGLLSGEGAFAIILLRAQRLRRNVHGRRVRMQSDHDCGVQTHRRLPAVQARCSSKTPLGMPAKDLHLECVDEVADPSGGWVAGAVTLTQKCRDIFLEKDGPTVAADGKDKLQLLRGHLGWLAALLVGGPMCDLAFAVLYLESAFDT